MKIFVFRTIPVQSLHESNLSVIKFSKNPKLFTVTDSRVLIRTARTHREIQDLSVASSIRYPGTRERNSNSHSGNVWATSISIERHTFGIRARNTQLHTTRENAIQSRSTYRCRACLRRMYVQSMHRTFTLSSGSRSSQVLRNTLSRPFRHFTSSSSLASLFFTRISSESEPANDVIVKLPMYLVLSE